MKYTESVKFALAQENVNKAFEDAKKAKTSVAKAYLGDLINKERTRYLKAKGWSNAMVAQELNVTERFVEKYLITE